MSFAKIYLHCVWSTKNREILIPNSFRQVLLAHFKEYYQSKEIYLDFWRKMDLKELRAKAHMIF
jgi:putative transposase